MRFGATHIAKNPGHGFRIVLREYLIVDITNVKTFPYILWNLCRIQVYRIIETLTGVKLMLLEQNSNINILYNAFGNYPLIGFIHCGLLVFSLSCRPDKYYLMHKTFLFQILGKYTSIYFRLHSRHFSLLQLKLCMNWAVCLRSRPRHTQDSFGRSEHPEVSTDFGMKRWEKLSVRCYHHVPIIIMPNISASWNHGWKILIAMMCDFGIVLKKQRKRALV